MGNITKTANGGTSYAASYGAGSVTHNQVTSGTTANYDGDGNQVLDTVTGFTWNAAGQVAETGGTTATYDALGIQAP